MNEPPNLLKRAILNQYNLILLGGSGVMALASQHWLPLAVGAGLETLWLVLGSDSSFFRRWVNVQDGLAVAQQRQERLDQARKGLDVENEGRIAALEDIRNDILELAKGADAMHNAVIQPELEKMAALLESFVRLASLRARLVSVRESTGERELQREISNTQRELQALDKKKKANPTLRASLATHLDLCSKRLESIEELRAQAAAIGVQLETIEQTFAYLKTNIANMASPEAFAGEIDNVLRGIDAAEKTFAETERLEMSRQPLAMGQK